MANTISDSNEGYAWQGLPNKNLPVKGTIKSDNGTSYENYAYDYDQSRDDEIYHGINSPVSERTIYMRMEKEIH